MAEQRLIDANALRGIESLLNTDIIQASKEASWLMSQVLHDIDAMSTIDPETLPIVQQLRAELARVTAERDAAVADMQALMWYSGDGCEICGHKIVEQRHPYTRLGCKLNGECNPKWCGAEDKND